MINVNWSQTKSIFSFHDQTRVSNKDNKSYSNVASERWYQNHDKNQIEQQHQNHIKFKSVSCLVSAPVLPTLYPQTNYKENTNIFFQGQ